MHIAIAGGSGFVGQELQKQLLEANVQISILTRSPEKIQTNKQIRAVKWLTEDSKPEEELESVDAIINLAGESINSGRWTEQRKKRILHSRMTATKEINRIISVLQKKPEVLINASAVGYYGMSETATFTEDSQSNATDFLAQVVQQWEREAKKVERYGVRPVFVRLGIVLGKGGALPLMALPYKLFAGGTVGSGRQWLSWIHVSDVARLMIYAIHNQDISGPLNATTNTPLQMREFGKAIGHVLKRPHWFPVPSFMIRLLLGEMSNMILSGQKVLPQKALEHGFTYNYPNVEAALEKSLR